MTDANPVRLEASSPTVELDFTYSVEWIPQEREFKDRFDRFLDADFFEHKVNHTCCRQTSASPLLNIKYVGALVLYPKFLHDGAILDWLGGCYPFENH